MAVGTEPFAAKSVRWVNDVDLADGVFLAFELDNVVRVPRFDECDIPDLDPLGQWIDVDFGEADGFAGLWSIAWFTIHPAKLAWWIGHWRSQARFCPEGLCVQCKSSCWSSERNATATRRRLLVTPGPLSPTSLLTRCPQPPTGRLMLSGGDPLDPAEEPRERRRTNRSRTEPERHCQRPKLQLLGALPTPTSHSLTDALETKCDQVIPKPSGAPCM